MSYRLVTVVEGHGEVQALPVLLRRIIGQISPQVWVDVQRPIRQQRSKLVKEDELVRMTELACLKAGESGGVLILLDADDDCPAELGPNLQAIVDHVSLGPPVAVVLADREYESWFLSAARSLQGHRGLPLGLDDVSMAEQPRDAKGWLQDRLLDGRSYSATVDQAAFSGQLDLAAARVNSPSFDKLWREIERLICPS